MKKTWRKALTVFCASAIVVNIAPAMSLSAAESYTWNTKNSQSGYEKISDLTATAPSAATISQEPPNNGVVSAAVDGLSATYWHSAYGNSVSDTNPAIGSTYTSDYNYVEVVLPEATDIVGVTYLPRQTNTKDQNGTFNKFKIQVSSVGGENAKDWVDVEIAKLNGASVEIGKGYTYSDNAEAADPNGYYVTAEYTVSGGWVSEQELIFKQVQEDVKYVRFYAKETHGAQWNQFMNAAELGVLKKVEIAQAPMLALDAPTLTGEAPEASATVKKAVAIDVSENPVELSGNFYPVEDSSLETTVYKGTFTVAGGQKLDKNAADTLAISFKYKRTSAPTSNDVVIVKKHADGSDAEYVLQTTDATNLQFWGNTQGWSQYDLTLANDFWGSWHDITLCFTENNFEIFVDDIKMNDSRPEKSKVLTNRQLPFVVNPSGDADVCFADFKMYTNLGIDVTDDTTKDALNTALANATKIFEIGSKELDVAVEECSVSTRWIDVAGNEVSEFEAGETYNAEITLEADDVHYFAESAMPTKLNFNGEEVDVQAQLSEDNTVMTMIYTYTMPMPEPVAEFTNGTASLKGKIDVNFYVKVNDTSALNDLSVKLTRGEDVVTSAFTDEAFTDGLYKFTFDVAAKEMTDVITAELMNAGETIATTSLSVKDYADAAKEYYPDDTKLEALLDAMLNYGAAAQNEFDYNTTDLANDGVEKDFTNTTITVDAAKITKGIDAKVVDVSNVSLLLKSDTTLRFYLKAGEGVDLSAYTVNPALAEGKKYAEFTNIAAKDLDEVKTFTVTDGTNTTTVEYSPLNYAKAVVDSETTSDTLKTVAKALYEYNVCADAYFGE